MLDLPHNRQYLFYWIKVARLISSLSRLNVVAIKEDIKNRQMKAMENLIKENDPIVHDKAIDSNRIM